MRKLGLACLLLLVLAAPLAAQQRVVAIGDIHGEYDAFVAILRQAELIDANLRWTGGRATLVQTGDYADRGPRVRQVMDLLMALEKDARKKKGQAVVLLGNHEVMNITGDLRYVSPEDYASYADADSEKRRQQAWEKYAAWQREGARALGQPEPQLTEAERQKWMEAHPAGFLEHREAFSRSGKYGRWLREKDTVAQVGDSLFLHGGISPQLLEWKLKAINTRVREELRLFDEGLQYLVERGIALPFFTLEELTQAARAELERAPSDAEHIARLENFLGYPNWFTFHPAGPLWFRGLAESNGETGGQHAAKVLETYDVQRVVLGHTPQRSGEVQARYGGKVFLIDTGMLSSYYPGGQASALEIVGERVTAVYKDRRAVLFPPAATSSALRTPESRGQTPGGGQEPAAAAAPAPAAKPQPAHRVWTGPEGAPLPFATDAELLEFLRTAQVKSMKGIGEGITRPRKALLEKDGIRMHAIFRDINESKTMAQMASGGRELNFRDNALFEPAAYELALMLGLDNVPPAVERKLQGKTGSLQVWVEGAMTEGVRVRKKKINPPDVLRWNEQVDIMRVFDHLVFNTDRNQGNILIDKDWKLWMIDHTRAFRRRDDLQDPKKLTRCDRALMERLRKLDGDLVMERLKPYLMKVEIEAILKRRDKMVAHFDQLIQQRGEQFVVFEHRAPAPADAATVAAKP